MYEMQPTDPVTLGGLAVLLVLVAALVSWLPARMDPNCDDGDCHLAARPDVVRDSLGVGYE